MPTLAPPFPAVLEALLRVRGPGVVCDFKTCFGYQVRAALLRLETRVPQPFTAGRGLCAVVRGVGAPGYVTEVLEVETLESVSCDGPPGWAAALP